MFNKNQYLLMQQQPLMSQEILQKITSYLYMV
jgi:hypothetical protein